jgi:serine/threonine-protein kinase
VAAVNNATGQRVAIRYLNENLVRDSGFLWGVRSASEQLISLNAPHVASVFDYAEQPGAGAAVVTELVNGVSLRKMITRRGPLSARAALVVFKDTLLGLAAAHSRHVAHRDVKPENVLIDATGWCTLTDFGLAVQTDKRVPAPGTPEYMAPELWNGAPNFPATDMYAATVMLGESLTGTPPFTGRPGRLREQHETAPAPLEEYDPPLRDLIGWGMDKYSDRRPPSARVFAGEVDARAADAYGPYWEDEGRRELGERAEELRRVLADEGDAGGAAGGGNSALGTWRARPMLVAFVASAAILVVAGAAAGAILLSNKPGVQIQPVSSVSAGNVSVVVTASPPVVVSKCNTPSTFTFTGTVTDVQPGTVSYQWQYSSGKLGPVATLNFTEVGAQEVTEAVTTDVAGDGWAQLNLLLNPGTKSSNKATYSLLCSASNGDITASAKIAPATLNLSSCSAPNPTLTATGAITSKNPGTVTYYWQRFDGTKTTPLQLLFNKAGTQSVKPLKFQASVPESGGVQLVVLKPAVAASVALGYTVTCPSLTQPAAPTQAAPTAKASVKPSASKSASPSKSPSPSPSKSPSPSPSPSPTKTTPSPPPTSQSPSPPPTSQSPSPPPSSSAPASSSAAATSA